MDENDSITDDEDFLELIKIIRNPRIRERFEHFQIWNDNEFMQRFRLSKDFIKIIVNEIRDTISLPTNRNHAPSTEDMVFVTLRFHATGSLLQVVGDFCGIDKSTASRESIRNNCTAFSQFYQIIDDAEFHIRKKKQGFYNIANCPRCIGVLDFTHIKILSPGGQDPENIRNRKGFISLNVQAICDADLISKNIVCRWPGSAHDSTIFNNSTVRVEFENGEYGHNLLVGDSGYGIRPFLITPLVNPRNHDEFFFTNPKYTRNPIERCFGVWKRRFPILAFGLRVKLDRIEAIVVATAVLHNIAYIMRYVQLTINEEEEPAVNFINNVDNVAVKEVGGINNSTRHALITQYFSKL